MSITATKVPVIDFTSFSEEVSLECQSTAREIYQACHDIGFMYLRNVDIDQELIERVFEESRHFFELPIDVKNQVAWSDQYSNRGYVGIERERLDDAKPGDLKEAFNVGKELNQDEIKSDQALIINKWPPGETAFRKTILEFYQACVEAAERVCQAFAIALGLPESFFIDRHNEQNYTLRLLHYPPVEYAPKPEQIRAGEHSDYGSFTLLFQDEVGGLEVKTAQGTWVEAPCLPGTIVVNTGDLMQRWTNHVFCSTKHRVKIPTDNRVQKSRYSIAFFCQPNFDTEISCLESCQSADRPPLYPPISSGDYLLSRLQATY